VYKAGKYLHDDVRILRHWKRQVRELGDSDVDMMAKIDEDAERVRVLCEKIKGEIEAEEQVGDEGEVYGRDKWEREADDSFRDVERSPSRSRGQEDALHDRRGGGRSRSPSPFRPQQRRRERREFDSWRPGSDRPGAAGRLGKHTLHY
jgi:hypothetical protein